MTEIGELAGISVGGTAALKCAFAHDKVVTPIEQPGVSVKSVERLRANLNRAISTCRFEDDGHRVSDAGPHAVEGLARSRDPIEVELESPRQEGGAEPGTVRLDGQDLPLSIAAHHVIPGEDGLPKSRLADLVWKSRGVIQENIGYDVDGSENGVWLPAHQGLSAAMGKRATVTVPDKDDPVLAVARRYRELSELRDEEALIGSFIDRYTQSAMNHFKRQFHDSHGEYSGRIVAKLDEMADSIWIAAWHCDRCTDAAGKKAPPPYAVVAALNALSQAVSSMLTRWPPSEWNELLVTSEYARRFCQVEFEFQRRVGAAR